MAESRSLVSVIMIFLDAERFMAEAIESVLRQSYVNWELILVDDGSTDGSTGIALDYARRFQEQIRYFEHDDHAWRGMSASRNLGVSAASGEFITFLDTDDAWTTDALEHLVSVLHENPDARLVYTPALWWYGWTGRAEDVIRDRVDMQPELPVNLPGMREGTELLSAILGDGGLVPCMCGIMVRGEALRGQQSFDGRFRNLYEDQVFLSRLALAGPLFLSHRPVSFYRQHGESFCARAEKTGEQFRARLVFLKWLGGLLAEHGVLSGPLHDRLEAEWVWHSAPARAGFAT